MKQLIHVKPTDRSKIDVANADALKQWAHNLGVTRDQWRLAIAKVGNSAAMVRKQLEILRKDAEQQN